MKKPENPSAFPAYKHGGMTLRDYFAGRAMQGILVRGIGTVSDTSGTAEAAYRLADAMLAERVKAR